MKKLSLLVLIAVLLLSVSLASAGSERHSIVLGQQKSGEACCYTFEASLLTIDKASLGFVSNDYGVIPFGDDHVAFEPCKFKGNDLGCPDWMIYDMKIRRSHILSKELPGFKRFLSTPAFRWPFVAYIGAGSFNEGERYDCVLYNWKSRKIVKIKTLFTEAHPSIGTDFPGFFDPPEFSKTGNSVTCEYSEYKTELKP